ncbi:MAG: hypothetical protein M1352_00330 [Patescibacteria group bacterium]|nr:hypothetical protein [Patescibacteria group bacterium]
MALRIHISIERVAPILTRRQGKTASVKTRLNDEEIAALNRFSGLLETIFSADEASDVDLESRQKELFRFVKEILTLGKYRRIRSTVKDMLKPVLGDSRVSSLLTLRQLLKAR